MTVLTKAEVDHLAETWTESHDTFMDAVYAALKAKEEAPVVPTHEFLVAFEADDSEAASDIAVSVIDWLEVGGHRAALLFVDDHDHDGDDGTCDRCGAPLPHVLAPGDRVRNQGSPVQHGVVLAGAAPGYVRVRWDDYGNDPSGWNDEAVTDVDWIER